MTSAILPRAATLTRLIELGARVAVAVRAIESDDPTTLEGVLVAAAATSITVHLHGVGDIEIPTQSLCSFRTITALPPLSDAHPGADAPTPPPC